MFIEAIGWILIAVFAVAALIFAVVGTILVLAHLFERAEQRAFERDHGKVER